MENLFISPKRNDCLKEMKNFLLLPIDLNEKMH